MTEPTSPAEPSAADVLQLIRTVLNHGGGYTRVAEAIQPLLDAATARAEQAEAALADEHATAVTRAQETDRARRELATAEARIAAVRTVIDQMAASRAIANMAGMFAQRLSAALDGPADTPAAEERHVCKPGALVYYCPTAGEIESSCHGGFDVCCSAPELHRPVEQAPAAPCDHRDPKRLATRPGDLAVVCACGAEVMAGLQALRQTEPVQEAVAGPADALPDCTTT
jgi:hypothetical protein